MPQAEPHASDFDLLEELNDRQRQAASHGDSPLLVIAGAGTGKTTTLAHRVAHLIASGTPAQRILLLTFTRRAAGEMLRRVDGILGRMEDARSARSPSAGKVWGGTFHAVATRLLRLHGPALGLDPAFTILDRGDSEDLMGLVRTELGLTKTTSRFPAKATCLDIYSRCVNAQERLEHVLKTRFPWCREHADDLAGLFSAYVDRKESHHVLDYDDLLLFWRALLDSPEGEAVRRRFDAVLVDEYQDTNALQAEIVRLLRPDGRGVTVVGDDAQSIYSFRAATVRNILDFPKLFDEVEVVALERNYRSTQPILEATNRVIAASHERHDKTLYTRRNGGEPPELVSCVDEAEQTSYLIEQILGHREQGLALRRQAVLFRASHHSLELEMELARRNIPFKKYGGLKFVETAHVKDLMALLRFAENPRDLPAGTRAAGLVPGVGPAKARQLMDLLMASDGDFEAWRQFEAPAAGREAWDALVDLMLALASHEGADAHDVPSQVHAARSFLGPLLDHRYDQPRVRARDLEQLEHAAARFTSRQRFLAELALDPPAWAEDLAGPPLLDDDWLVLSTIHSAKGLEWDAVYVIHAADGNIPSDMATGSAEEIEEERRLFYVALTRAKQWLYVTHPLRYYSHPRLGDAHGYSQVSRFLLGETQAAFQVRPAYVGTQADDEEQAAAATGVDTASVRAGMKRMWQ